MAKREKKPPEPEAGAPLWMATFGDLMSLLLTFFVLLVSMSSIQETKFKVAIESFRNALSWFEGNPPWPRIDLNLPAEGADKARQEEPVIPSQKTEPIATVDNIIRIAREIQTKVAELDIAGQIQVYFNSKEVRIYIPESVMFLPGTAKFESKRALDVMSRVLDLVIDIPYPLNIEGYTDSTPPSAYSTDYETNWELASARALAVLHYLNRNGVAGGRLKAVAYGATKPNSDNPVPEERWRENRVEIVIRDTAVQ